MRFEAVLFDKDGTLIDFKRSWLLPYKRAAQDLAAAAGEPPEFADLLLERYGYDCVEDEFEQNSILVWSTNLAVLRAFSREKELRAVDVEAVAGPHLLTPGRYKAAAAIDDLDGLLTRLGDRGLALGLATMDNSAKAAADLDDLGVAGHFRFVAGVDSGFGAKPGPGMAQAFADAVDVAPERCVMIGDSVADLEMARAAGFGARLGVGPHRHVLEGHADALYPDIGGLERFLARD